MNFRSYMKKLEESFIGNEVIPYMLDAIENKKDISTRKEAINYMEKLVQSDEYVKPVINFLKHISDIDYKSLHKLTMEYEQ